MPPSTPKTPVTVEPKTPATPASDAPVEAPEVPKRFEHPDAFSVLILAPFCNTSQRFVTEQLAEEFSYHETPPRLVGEMRADQLFPGVVIYTAYPTQVREKDPDTGRFQQVEKLRVSEPIKLKDFFGVNAAGGGGLDLERLMVKVRQSIVNERGSLMYWCVRPTADGGFKILDN